MRESELRNPWSLRARAQTLRVAVVLLMLLGHSRIGLTLEVPNLQARVTDLAGVLTPDQIRSLEAKLQELESTDSTQVAVLIIPTLEDESLEDYSHRVASAWRLGQTGRDNGALVLLAMKERKIRIEVGYGLEPTLTDARSRRVIQNDIVPHFKQGDFYSGIDAGVTGIIQVVRGNYQATPARSGSNRSSGRRSFDWIIFLFVPLLWVLGSAGKWGGGILGAGGGAVVMGMVLGFGWIGFLLGGLIGGAVGAFLGAIARASRGAPTRRRWGGPVVGPWYSDSGGSGGFGGSSGRGFSDGGGFSGGGGSFGGGGASGNW